MPAETGEKAPGLTPPTHDGERGAWSSTRTHQTEKGIDLEGTILAKRVEPFAKDHPDRAL